MYLKLDVESIPSEFRNFYNIRNFVQPMIRMLVEDKITKLDMYNIELLDAPTLKYMLRELVVHKTAMEVTVLFDKDGKYANDLDFLNHIPNVYTKAKE